MTDKKIIYFYLKFSPQVFLSSFTQVDIKSKSHQYNFGYVHVFVEAGSTETRECVRLLRNVRVRRPEWVVVTSAVFRFVLKFRKFAIKNANDIMETSRGTAGVRRRWHRCVITSFATIKRTLYCYCVPRCVSRARIYFQKREKNCILPSSLSQRNNNNGRGKHVSITGLVNMYASYRRSWGGRGNTTR